MPMPNRDGRFRAEVKDAGITESGKNKLATVQIRLSLIDEQAGGEWKNVEREGMEITAYCYLERKGGSVNTRTVESLRESFPEWDGADLAYWDRSAGQMCQVTLGYEQYDGKDRLKVQWINPYDSTPGGDMKKAGPEERRSIANRLGAKLRAMSSGSPVPPRPAPTKPAPSAPPSRPKTQEDDPRGPITSTEEKCWELFQNKNEKLPEAEQGAAWFKFLKDNVGKDENLTPQDWGKISCLLDEIPF